MTVNGIGIQIPVAGEEAWQVGRELEVGEGAKKVSFKDMRRGIQWVVFWKLGVRVMVDRNRK